jgi:hypothetical protein
LTVPVNSIFSLSVYLLTFWQICDIQL